MAGESGSRSKRSSKGVGDGVFWVECGALSGAGMGYGGCVGQGTFDYTQGGPDRVLGPEKSVLRTGAAFDGTGGGESLGHGDSNAGLRGIGDIADSIEAVD